MKTIKQLDTKDMAEVIASFFKVRPEMVRISIEPISRGYGAAEHTEYTASCTVEITDTGEDEEMDWTAAKEHLDTYEAEYRKLPALVGTFGLTRILDLQDRFARGERTRFLYDDIMSVE